MAKVKTKDGEFKLSEEAQLISKNFNANKGRLPWPLQKGIIVSSFGIQKNKAISGVETKNNGNPLI